MTVSVTFSQEIRRDRFANFHSIQASHTINGKCARYLKEYVGSLQLLMTFRLSKRHFQLPNTVFQKDPLLFLGDNYFFYGGIDEFYAR